MKKYRTGLFFGDVHGESRYLDLLHPYLVDAPPDILGIVGDLFDFKEISEYDRHQRHYIGLEKLTRRVEDEIAWGNAILDRYDNDLPRTEKIFFIGNHDARYEKFAKHEQTQFRLQDRLLENRLHLRERGWKIVRLGGHHRVGKLYLMHGEKVNGDLFAKTAALKFRKNVRLWHHHTNQSYCITSALEGPGAIEVKAVGCMCGKDPGYLRGLTNRWINSFLVARILPNGNFQDFTINIINDRFITPEGKIYGRKA